MIFGLKIFPEKKRDYIYVYISSLLFKEASLEILIFIEHTCHMLYPCLLMSTLSLRASSQLQNRD